MRNFIQGCGAVFVVLGAITFAITVYTALVSASQSGSNGFGTFLAIMSGGAVFGAGITLVGGTAYLLASIDARLEEDARLRSLAAAAAKSAPGIATPQG